MHTWQKNRSMLLLIPLSSYYPIYFCMSFDCPKAIKPNSIHFLPIFFNSISLSNFHDQNHFINTLLYFIFFWSSLLYFIKQMTRQQLLMLYEPLFSCIIQLFSSKFVILVRNQISKSNLHVHILQSYYIRTYQTC